MSIITNTSKIGESIQRIREELGYSLTDVSEMLGWGHISKLSMYEKGIRKIPIDHLASIAKIYKCTIDDIVNGKSINQIKSIPELDSNSIVNYIKYGSLPTQSKWRMINMLMENLDSLFAYRNNSDAMEGIIEVGDLLVVDYNRNPEPNDIVLMRIGDNDIKVRRYVVDGTDILLKSDNKTYNPISFNSIQMEIIGVVIECQRSTYLVSE